MSDIKPKWTKSDKTIVIVFNVGRGLAIFIRMPNNKCIIYDMGSSEDFSPAEVIKDEFIDTGYIKGVSQLFVSHPHKDHFQESDVMIGGTIKQESIELITMPNFEDFSEEDSVGRKNEKLDETFLSQQMSEDDIKQYKAIYADRKPPLCVVYADDKHDNSVNEDIECGLFYMRPPDVKEIHGESVQEYGNGTSLCFYYRHNKHVIWIQGDITPEVMKKMINASSDEIERRFSHLKAANLQENDSLYGYNPLRSGDNPYPSSLLSDADMRLINVAPHHGLQSCYSEDFFEVANPIVNIISESHGNNGTVDRRYSNHDKGVYVRSGEDCSQDTGGKRKSLTTRKDGHILMVLGSDGDPVFYHSTAIEQIINAMNELS